MPTDTKHKVLQQKDMMLKHGNDSVPGSAYQPEGWQFPFEVVSKDGQRALVKVTVEFAVMDRDRRDAEGRPGFVNPAEPQMILLLVYIDWERAEIFGAGDTMRNFIHDGRSISTIFDEHMSVPGSWAVSLDRALSLFAVPFSDKIGRPKWGEFLAGGRIGTDLLYKLTKNFCVGTDWSSVEDLEFKLFKSKQSGKALAKAKLGEAVPPGQLAYVFKTAAGYYAKNRQAGNSYSNPIWFWTPDLKKARRVTKTHGINLRMMLFIERPDLFATAELIADPVSAKGAIAGRLGESKALVRRLLEGQEFLYAFITDEGVEEAGGDDEWFVVTVPVYASEVDPKGEPDADELYAEVIANRIPEVGSARVRVQHPDFYEEDGEVVLNASLNQDYLKRRTLRSLDHERVGPAKIKFLYPDI